jgi:WD40 repeat protein
LIQLQDGRIASGSGDQTIRIWKRADASGDEDGTSIVWKGHTCSVLCLIQLKDGRIASGSHDNTIHIWNVDGHSSVVCQGNYIIPIYTKQDIQQGRHALYELLADYIIEDVKSIVYQYVKPL